MARVELLIRKLLGFMLETVPTVLEFLRENAPVFETLAVVVLVGVTWTYARYTKRILEENQRQRRFFYIFCQNFRMRENSVVFH